MSDIEPETAVEDMMFTICFKSREFLVGAIIVKVFDEDDRSRIIYCIHETICNSVIIDTKFNKILEVNEIQPAKGDTDKRTVVSHSVETSKIKTLNK